MTTDNEVTRKITIGADTQNFNFVTAIGWIMITIGAFLGVVAWL